MTTLLALVIAPFVVIGAVAHEEQKYATFNLKARVRTLEVENAKLRADLMTDAEWDSMVEQALAVSR